MDYSTEVLCVLASWAGFRPTCQGELSGVQDSHTCYRVSRSFVITQLSRLSIISIHSFWSFRSLRYMSKFKCYTTDVPVILRPSSRFPKQVPIYLSTAPPLKAPLGPWLVATKSSTWFPICSEDWMSARSFWDSAYS